MLIAQLMQLLLTISCFSKSNSFLTAHEHIIGYSVPYSKSRSVLLFWYRLNRVVSDKWPLNGCCLLHFNFVTTTSVNERMHPHALCVVVKFETDQHYSRDLEFEQK